MNKGRTKFSVPPTLSPRTTTLRRICKILHVHLSKILLIFQFKLHSLQQIPFFQCFSGIFLDPIHITRFVFIVDFENILIERRIFL